MKGMILAAGLGSRLRPLTDTMPKALVVVNGKTLLEHSIEHLKCYGVDEIIVNVHHFAGQVIDYLNKNNNFGIHIGISDETAELLDTGGGLKKAASFFDDGKPFFLRNVDILSGMDLAKMMDVHLETASLGTLAVKKRATSRYFLFDNDQKLCGWLNESTGERVTVSGEQQDLQKAAFSGIQVLDPRIFPLITETGKFSLTGMYLRLARENRITGFPDEEAFWEDAGKKIPEGYFF